MDVDYAVGGRLSVTSRSLIAAGQKPCPEYLHYIQHFPANLITYDDISRADALFASSLDRLGLLSWGFMGLPLHGGTPSEVILSSGEDVGLPLALDAKVNRLSHTIAMITHGFLFRESRMMRAVRQVETAKFLCLSQRIQQKLVYDYHLPEERVLNTGYGVDSLFFTPVGPPLEPFMIASAGAANRDYRTLLEATKHLQVKVHIAADSEWHPRATNIERDQISPWVTIATCGSYVNLRTLYSHALFVVVPLLPAPFACGYAVIAEAMSMGRAVIATDTECRSDLIKDGETGFYVKPGDPADLCDKMSYLLSHPERALEMGIRARKLIVSEFSLHAYCQRLYNSISDVNGGRNR